MKIQILEISETKDKNIQSLERQYEKRLKPFFQLETVTLKASRSDEPTKAKTEELEKFLLKLDPRATQIALDEHGKMLTSEEFAKFLRCERDFGPGKIQFLIGGSHGLHSTLLTQAKHIFSLSKMTFTHEMVRVFLKEQLYRAACILAGKRYHK